MTTKDTKMIFAPLRAKLAEQHYSLADLMEAAFNWIENDKPAIGLAMFQHMRDIDAEQRTIPNDSPDYITGWGALMGEVYWRTFFDLDHAQKYGTTDLIESGPDTLQRFVDTMLVGLSEEPPQPGQHDAPASVH